MRSYRWRPAAKISDLVAERPVRLVADGRDDGDRAGSHGPAELFVAPWEQRRRIPTAPRQHHDLDLRVARKTHQRLDYGEGSARPAHRCLLHRQRVPGEPRCNNRFDVLAHRGIGPAQHPDDLG